MQTIHLGGGVEGLETAEKRKKGREYSGVRKKAKLCETRQSPPVL